MGEIVTEKRQYYRDEDSGIVYFATRTGPLKMNILREDRAGRPPALIAVIRFSDIYNPDGPWYAQQVAGIPENRVHKMRFQHPEPCAMAIAKEDAFLAFSQRRYESSLPSRQAEARADLDRFFDEAQTCPAPAEPQT